MRTLYSIMFLLLLFSTFAGISRGQNFNEFPDSLSMAMERQLLSVLKKNRKDFSANYDLGMLHYNRAEAHIRTFDSSFYIHDIIYDVMQSLDKSKTYLQKAYKLDSTDVAIQQALKGISYMTNTVNVETSMALYMQKVGQAEEIDAKSYRVINGDTINKIDEVGMLQGEWERMYPDGSFKCRGVYRDNKKNGYWERKYNNGNWQYQVHFVNGYPHGYGKWYYSNGNLKTEGEFVEGRENGPNKKYYENGNLMSEEVYKKGKISGLCQYYNDQGVLIRAGEQQNEIRTGEWQFFSDEGLHTTTVVYKEGAAVKTKVITD